MLAPLSASVLGGNELAVHLNRRLFQWGSALLLTLSSGAVLAQDNPAPAYTLDAVVEQMSAHQQKALLKLEQREQHYAERLSAAESKLAKAHTRLSNLEARGTRLEGQFESNRVELDDKAKLLTDKIGALKELFGVFQQNASDLIGVFVNSPTSIEYPDRDVWLEGFANRMKNASEVSSVDDIRALWFEIQREIAATDDIVRLRATVVDQDGEASERDIVRVGTFNLLTSDPQPAYLNWDGGRQQVVTLARQPGGDELMLLDDFLGADQGLHALAVDPTRGPLLELLVEKPTLPERVDQGGLVGYMILSLGALSLVLAAFKLIDILLLSLGMSLQGRKLDNPSAGNPLGRLLQTWNKYRERDPEVLAMRLHDRVSKESGRIHRFTIFLAIIAAVAPLMGLLGTVVGMINTFQAITLYGTGDPQTMAGGISQALITTVLGLVVAVPAVLLHALVSARGKGLVNRLQQQSAALTGDALASRGASHGPADNLPPAAPAPAPA